MRTRLVSLARLARLAPTHIPGCDEEPPANRLLFWRVCLHFLSLAGPRCIAQRRATTTTTTTKAVWSGLVQLLVEHSTWRILHHHHQHHHQGAPPTLSVLVSPARPAALQLYQTTARAIPQRLHLHGYAQTVSGMAIGGFHIRRKAPPSPSIARPSEPAGPPGGGRGRGRVATDCDWRGRAPDGVLPESLLLRVLAPHPCTLAIMASWLVTAQGQDRQELGRAALIVGTVTGRQEEARARSSPVTQLT